MFLSFEIFTRLIETHCSRFGATLNTLPKPDTLSEREDCEEPLLTRLLRS